MTLLLSEKFLPPPLVSAVTAFHYLPQSRDLKLAADRCRFRGKKVIVSSGVYSVDVLTKRTSKRFRGDHI